MQAGKKESIHQAIDLVGLGLDGMPASGSGDNSIKPIAFRCS
jgi:hypothetical protein